MPDPYLVDLIDIVNVDYDEWGTATETITANVAARVEDENQLVKDRNGQEVVSNTFIIIDKSASLNYDSKIIIRKKADETFTYDLKMGIIKAGKQEGFKNSHWEVYL